MKSVTVHVDVFEGPMDLLYHLIEKNEIDIYDIPIADVTDQYIEYLSSIEERDMDDMSLFILMAATLIEIKSKMLLPNEKDEKGEEHDPREQLIQKLIEYKKFKRITEEFKAKEEEAALVFFKNPEKLMFSVMSEIGNDTEDILNGISMDDIYKAFRDVMHRKEGKTDKVRSGFKAVARDLYTVNEKTEFIKDMLVLNPKVSFFHIFRDEAEKMEIVVTFLAVLELIKQRYIIISQEKNFGEIIIQKNNGSENK